MGCAFVFRSNTLAGAAVPLCIGPTHGRTGRGPLWPRRDEIRREHSLELLSRLGGEELGTRHYRAISASAGVPNVTQITFGKLCPAVIASIFPFSGSRRPRSKPRPAV